MRSVDCSNALFALERQSFRPGYSAGRDRFKIDTEKKLKRPPKAASQCADKFAEWKDQGLGEIFGLAGDGVPVARVAKRPALRMLPPYEIVRGLAVARTGTFARAFGGMGARLATSLTTHSPVKVLGWQHVWRLKGRAAEPCPKQGGPLRRNRPSLEQFSVTISLGPRTRNHGTSD